MLYFMMFKKTYAILQIQLAKLNFIYNYLVD